MKQLMLFVIVIQIKVCLHLLQTIDNIGSEVTQKINKTLKPNVMLLPTFLLR